jgi:hypothetical protein
MGFGLMQTKVAMVPLMSNYQISVRKKTQIPTVFDPKSNGLLPAGGMWLQIKKRVQYNIAVQYVLTENAIEMRFIFTVYLYYV